MNETDTRARLIDPAILAAGWDEEQIEREVVIAGRRVDYVLRHGGRIVAVVEAKARGRLLDGAITQAQDYAGLLRAPWALATNGTKLIIVPMGYGQPRPQRHHSEAVAWPAGTPCPTCAPGPHSPAHHAARGTPRAEQARTVICPECKGTKVLFANQRWWRCRICQGIGMVFRREAAAYQPWPIPPQPPVPPGTVEKLTAPRPPTPPRPTRRRGNVLLVVSLIVMLGGLTVAGVAAMDAASPPAPTTTTGPPPQWWLDRLVEAGKSEDGRP